MSCSPSSIAPRLFAVLAISLTPVLAMAQTQAPSTPPSDAPVVTASASGAGAPPASPQTGVRSVDGDRQTDQDIQPDGKPHGFISVGVGNRGYREVAGAVTVPVGDTGQATIAISDQQGQGVRVR